MARYIATSGSNFRPFTYDEMVKPLQQMTDTQNAIADTYDTLNLETEALRQYITNNPDDSDALRIYNNYTTKLKALQDGLWNNGITAQTRRDLSAARAGYADVNRVKTAIQNRNDRSKEYWDTKHNHPDMILGDDPGLSGLNNYLKDDNYGRNWYSYSGAQFSKEVGDDARARANELMRNPEYMKNPELAGYITRITQDGFTSAEVENASAIAKQILETGNTSALEKAALPESILTSVLLSHLESTGARGNVSGSEFKRLFDYGRAGLSQAIGKVDFKDLQDNNWELWAQKELAKYKYDLDHSTPPDDGNDKPKALPYTLNDIASYMEAENAKRINDTLGGKFIEPFKEPIIVNNADGSSDVISNPFDAERILNSFGREYILNAYGVDPDSPEGIHKLSDGQGGEIPVRVRRHVGGTTGSNYSAIPLEGNPYLYEVRNVKGDWEVDEEQTKNMNADILNYRSKIKEWKNANNGVNIQKLAISQKQRDKIYDEYDIPEDVPMEDIPYILQVKSSQGYVTPATIAGSTIDMDAARKNYTRQIITSFSREAGSEGKVAKKSPFAFYPVDGYNISEKGIRDIKEVLADSKGNITDDAVTEIVVYPEDLDDNKVRFTANGKQYAVDASMLGNDMNYQIQRLRQPVDFMMTPILDPVDAMRMTPEENASWVYNTANLLGQYFSPVIVDDNDNIVGYITPRDIVKSERLQGELRTAVTRFMNNVLADPRDNMMLNNYRVRGNSSDKATPYNTYTK